LHSVFRAAGTQVVRERPQLPGLCDGGGVLQRAQQLWFWPGGAREGAFYSYAYPRPDGFAAFRVEADAAYFSEEYGEFLLPHEAVRTADDPDHALARFLQATYEAAAELGGWNRVALEDNPDRLPSRHIRQI
jgi:Family of unknown function (DUF5996)